MNANAKPNTGFLNQNTKKNAENQPDIVGFLDIEFSPGNIKRMRIAGWARTNDRGKFYSLRLSEDTMPQRKPAAPTILPAAEEDDDSIPF